MVKLRGDDEMLELLDIMGGYRQEKGKESVDNNEEGDANSRVDQGHGYESCHVI